MDGPINFSATERSEMDNKAEIYSIILATELLERAFIRDAISPEAYTPACLNLIAQFKTAVALLPELSIDAFMAQYRLDAPAAKTRLLDFGVPATYQHATNQYGNNAASAKHVAETVQLFITLMDSIKLNLCAVDQLHPLLSDLIQSLNRVSSLPSSFTGKEKVTQWLITLNKKKASDSLDEESSRQMLFDMESAYTEFHRHLDT